MFKNHHQNYRFSLFSGICYSAPVPEDNKKRRCPCLLTSKSSALIFTVNTFSQKFPYLYNPILNTTAIKILIHPVVNLEIVIAAIPTCVVSGLASVIPRPTGMKSQAHWQLMAKSAGSAITGGILPASMSSPITVETDQERGAVPVTDIAAAQLQAVEGGYKNFFVRDPAHFFNSGQDPALLRVHLRCVRQMRIVILFFIR